MSVCGGGGGAGGVGGSQRSFKVAFKTAKL